MVSDKEPTPYNNHVEHLYDILEMSKFNQPDQSNTDYSKASFIKKRVELSNIFLPLEYIVNIFNLAKDEVSILYNVAAKCFLEVLGKEDSNIFNKMDGIKYLSSNNNLLKYIFIIDKNNLTVKFKPRIKEFIFSPNSFSNESWIEYYQPKKDSELILINDIYNVTENLYLNFSIKTSRNNIISLYGKTGIGRQSLIKQISNNHEIPIIFIDISKIILRENFEDIIESVIIEGVLSDFIICFSNIEKLFEKDSEIKKILFFEQLYGFPKTCFFTSNDKNDFFEYEKDFSIIEIKMQLPNSIERKSLWNLFLGEFIFEQELDLSDVSIKYELTPYEIIKAVEEGYKTAISEGSEIIKRNDIYDICQRLSSPILSSLGTLIKPIFKWEDLVLPEEQKSLLSDAIKRVESKHKVYKEWGFESKLPYGKGLSMLFTGPPGTGKTMASQVIANMLGLYLYKIDLPLVVSKYIGETEKNLKEIFDEAESGNYILFFDEADSLFGKRTEIKDSHDRNANMEVSFLLQRLEDFNGITILATNIVKNFDDAFKRRFQFIVDFPLPDFDCRKLIWDRVFPAKTPLSDSIDVEFLSKFKLTGSIIKNIAVSAAFLAASQSDIVSMNYIIEAIKIENIKNGLGIDLKLLNEYE